MELLWSLVYLALFIWIMPKIPFFKNSGISASGIRIFFALKVIMGIALILVYRYYYPPGSADIFNYFNDSKVLHSALAINPYDYLSMITGIGDDAPHLMHYYDKMNFWLKDFNYNMFNDNKTVIRFNAIVMLFSFKNIFVHTYIINIFSLAGLVGIYRFLRQIIKTKKLIALIVVALPPSLLFWGSGLLKEGIVLFALGMLLFAIAQISRNQYSYRPYFILMFALAVFSISKFYVLLAVIPAMLSFYAAKTTGKDWLAFLSVHLLLLIGIFILPYIGLPDIPELISKKQHDFINYVHSLNHVGSYIESPKLSTNFWDFILHGFRGLFITLFRPHPFEVHNLATIPATLENVITALLIIASLIFRNKQLHTKSLLFLMSFTVILFALAGMTTPVLGALVRYKIPAQPFLYALLLMSINWDAITNRLERKWAVVLKYEMKLEHYLFN